MQDDKRALLRHESVMVSEVMRLLNPRPGEVMVDGTLGCAGHAAAMARAVGEAGLVIGLDRDGAMVARARERLSSLGVGNVQMMVGNFSEMQSRVSLVRSEGVDGVLLDLGFASPQLEDPARGFSFSADGPLDMRMARGEGPSAEEVVNGFPEEDLARILRGYGEERFARRIAGAIVRARAQRRIRRTTDLAEVIRQAVPGRRGRLHPATRSFQALRIFVNREIEHLERFLEALPLVLRPGGRCAIVSYHSLEDRPVKRAFRAGARSGVYELLTRKPLRPSDEEVRLNRRSRSAKLRGVRRACETVGGKMEESGR